MVGTAHARLCPPCGAWGTHDTRESASFTRAKHLQLRNAIFGAIEPPTKLAALHHHHIRMNVGLAARVEFSGRELVCTAGLSATTLADRFCISMSVISPKKSPGSRRAMRMTRPASASLLTTSSPE
jgi:hypothetical protein